MIIIVEGIDRVGKTTLVNRIAERFNYKIFKDTPIHDHSYKNSDIMSEKLNQLVLLIEGKFITDAILDRGYWTEYVYGQINRHYINNDILDFDRRLGKLDNVIQIYVQPEDIKWSSEMHGSDLSEHNKLMDKVMFTTNVRTIKTSFTKFDETMKLLEDIVK